MRVAGLLQIFTSFLLMSTSLSGVEPRPSDYVLAKEKSKLEFISTTSSGKNVIPGTFSDWDISATTTGPKLTDIRVDVAVRTASVDTSNKKRDSHLRKEDFFWSDKYPQATFTSTKITDKGNGTFRIEGDFTLRGKKKAIEFDAKVEGKYRIKGEFKLNRQDFGITYQAFFLLPSIDDTVVVKFDLVAEPKKS